MREYLVFLGVCMLIGFLPRLIPGAVRPKVLKGLERFFWMFSVPTLVAFLGFALIEYVKGLGNLSTVNLLFLDLLTGFALYYCGALALAAGKMHLGITRCSRHEDVALVCPECRKGSGRGRDTRTGEGA